MNVKFYLKSDNFNFKLKVFFFDLFDFNIFSKKINLIDYYLNNIFTGRWYDYNVIFIFLFNYCRRITLFKLIFET